MATADARLAAHTDTIKRMQSDQQEAAIWASGNYPAYSPAFNTAAALSGEDKHSAPSSSRFRLCSLSNVTNRFTPTYNLAAELFCLPAWRGVSNEHLVGEGGNESVPVLRHFRGRTPPGLKR